MTHQPDVDVGIWAWISQINQMCALLSTENSLAHQTPRQQPMLQIWTKLLLKIGQSFRFGFDLEKLSYSRSPKAKDSGQLFCEIFLLIQENLEGIYWKQIILCLFLEKFASRK